MEPIGKVSKKTKILGMLGIIFALVLLIALLTIVYFFTKEEIGDTLQEVVMNQIDAPKQLKETKELSRVLTKADTTKKVIAITLDGLTDSTQMLEIIEILDQYQIQATFFPQAVLAKEDEEVIKAIIEKGYEVGNYTLSAKKHMENMTEEELVLDFMKSRLVIEGITHKNVNLLKCNGTEYTDAVLHSAKAAGADIMVQSTSLLSKSSFRNYDAAEGFVNTIESGSIISIKLDEELDIDEYEPYKQDEKPAEDMKAGIQYEKEEIEDKDLVECIRYFAQAVHNMGYETVFVKDLPKYDGLIEDYAQKEMDLNGEMAKVYKQLPNSKDWITLSFKGILNKEHLEEVIDVLEKHRAKATFYVTGKEIREYPEEIKLITEKGHTIGTAGDRGIVLTGADFAKTYEEIKGGLEALEEVEGNKCRYYLPCYGKYDTTIQKAAKALGCTVVTYSKNPIIDQEKPIDEIMMCFSEGIKNGDIIYFDLNYHDEVAQVVEEVLTLSEKSTLKVETADKLMQYYVPNKHYSYANQSNNRVRSSTTLVTLDKVEESAEEKEKETELIMLQEEIKLLIEKNNGKLATEQKSLKLVEDAIAFEFYGISNITTVNLVVETLEEMNARGTFFVSLEDTETCGNQIEIIKNAGHEIGIAYCPRRDATVNDIALTISQTKQALFDKYGVQVALVFQPWSKISDELKEATSAMDLTLVSYDTGIVRTEQKGVTNAQSVMDVIFNQYNYCAVQGQIFYFRMDYYTDENVLTDVMKLLKEQKIDNIKYRPEDEELAVDFGKYDGYEIISVSDLLRSDMVYIYPMADDKMTEAIANGVYEKKVSAIDVMEAADKGYIGTPSIYQEDKLPGFTEEEIKQLDYSGLINTDKNEIFLSFDDWGSDAAINQLLYVLEKHQVKATFFVSTQYVRTNPNLLRKIALAGHQLASHTDQHITLSTYYENTKIHYELSEEELEIFEKDIVTSYETLKSIAGDIVINDVPAVTNWFRPPTLAVGRNAMEVVFASGYSYILSGNISTHDYEAQCVDDVYNAITDNLYHEDGSLIKGSLIVMHMSDEAKYTAEAIDVLLTENEKKSEGDTSKFTIGNLSDYLRDNEYHQGNLSTQSENVGGE